MESELVAGFMTEHGASIFVFFFLGEYSSLILMSAFMSIFFLGGHHCPNIHNLILDVYIYIYNYFWSKDISSVISLFSYLNNFVFHSSNLIKESEIIYPQFFSWNYETITIFSSKDTLLESANIIIDRIYGSYILGLKIIIVVFFFIWVRASFPRLRYDQLMSLCWKELLPLVFAYIIFTVCLFYTFDMLPYGNNF